MTATVRRFTKPGCGPTAPVEGMAPATPEPEASTGGE
jgi:hypothetical protein